MTLGLNIIFGLSVPNIDMAAHFGGLAGGFISALVLGHDLSPAGFKTRKKRGIIFTALATALLLASYLTIKTQFKVPINQTLQKLDNIAQLCATNEKQTKLLLAELAQFSDINKKNDFVSFWKRMLIEWQTTYQQLKDHNPFGISNKRLEPFDKIFELHEEKIQLYIKSLEDNTIRYQDRISAIDKELEPFIKN